MSCPACGVGERKDGRPVCNRCMKLVDYDLEKRWFNQKAKLRKEPHNPTHASSLLESTVRVVEQVKERRRDARNADSRPAGLGAE